MSVGATTRDRTITTCRSQIFCRSCVGPKLAACTCHSPIHGTHTNTRCFSISLGGRSDAGGRRHRYGHQLHRASGGSGRPARAHRQGFRRSRPRARGHRLRIRHLGWDGTRCRGYRVGEALLPGRGRAPCLTVPVRLATPFSTQLRAIHVWRTSCEVSAGKFDPPGSEGADRPIFKAASVTLAVSREKDGKLRLVYAGWDERLLCWTSHELASALRPETVHCRSLISHSRRAVSVSCASGVGGLCSWSKKYAPLTFATCGAVASHTRVSAPFSGLRATGLRIVIPKFISRPLLRLNPVATS